MAGVAGMGGPSKLPLGIAKDPEIPQADLSNLGQFQMAPSAPPEERAPASEDYDAMLNQALAETETENYDAILDQALAADTEPVSGETLGIFDQLKQAPTRLRGSFARTPKELKQVLEDEYGKGNVREVAGTLEYKMDGKWREFDKGVEVIGDVLDFGRDVVEEIPASLGTAAGAALGFGSTVASGGVGGVAAPALVAGGRAAGAVAGQALGDFLAGVMGIERDEDRSAAMEYGLTAVLSPLAGVASDYAGKVLANRAARAASKELKAPAELYKTSIENVRNATDYLQSQGLLQNIPGTDTPVILSQLVPESKVAKELAKSASALPEFEQVLKLQQDMITENVDNFTSMLSKNADVGLGQRFKNTTKEIIKAEGKMIGDIRKELVEASGNADLPVPNLKNKLEAFRTELGFKEGMNADNVAKELIDNGFDAEGARVVSRKVEKLYEDVFNREGKLTASQLLGYYNELNGVYANVADKGLLKNAGYQKKIGELRSFVADELTDKVNVISGGDASKSYVKNLQRFKELAEARTELAGVISANQVNSNVLARSIFDKGKDGLDKLKATKDLLRDEPELMSEVVGQYFKNIKAMPGVVNEATGKLNYDKFLGEVKKLGPEMMEEAFGKENAKVFEAFKVLSKAVESGKIAEEGLEDSSNLIKNIAIATGAGSVYAGGSAVLSSVMSESAKKALASIVAKDGMEKVLKQVPKNSRPLVQKAIEGITNPILKAASATVPGTITSGAEVGTRQMIRDKDR